MPAPLPVLRTARLDVGRACALLRSPSPEALDKCAGLLEGALAGLSAARPVLVGPDEPALAEAFRLQAAVRSAASLLQGAADYHARWVQILGTMTAGYTAAGEAAAVARPQRVCLSG